MNGYQHIWLYSHRVSPVTKINYRVAYLENSILWNYSACDWVIRGVTLIQIHLLGCRSIVYYFCRTPQCTDFFSYSWSRIRLKGSDLPEGHLQVSHFHGWEKIVDWIIFVQSSHSRLPLIFCNRFCVPGKISPSSATTWSLPLVHDTLLQCWSLISLITVVYYKPNHYKCLFRKKGKPIQAVHLHNIWSLFHIF